MLKLIGWLVKASFFAAVILVLGNLIHWRGRTVSDQVKAQLGHVEKVKNMAMGYTHEAQATRLWTQTPATKKLAHPHVSTYTGSPKARSEEARSSEAISAPEQIAPSEQQKLRSLIGEQTSGRARKVSDNP